MFATKYLALLWMVPVLLVCACHENETDRYYDNFEIRMSGQLLDARSGSPLDMRKLGPEIAICLDGKVLDADGKDARVIGGKTYPYSLLPHCESIRNETGLQEVFFPDDGYLSVRAFNFEFTNYEEARFRLTGWVQPTLSVPRDGGSGIGWDAYYDIGDLTLSGFSVAITVFRAQTEQFTFQQIQDQLGPCWSINIPWKGAERLTRISKSEYTFDGADRLDFRFDPSLVQDFFTPVTTPGCFVWSESDFHHWVAQYYDNKVGRTWLDILCSGPGMEPTGECAGRKDLGL